MRRLSFKIFLCLLPLLFSANCYSLEWQDLWQTPDQQGEKAFQQKQYDQAAEQFTQPQWKAAAQYEQGEYQQVLETLKDIQSSDAMYNKGNAQAQLGQFKEAIQAYDKTLQLDPENADAKFNKELIEKELEKRQQEQDQQQGDSDSEQQKQDKGNSQEQDQQDQEGGQQEQNEDQQGQEREQNKGEKGENADSQNKSSEENADDNQKGAKSQQQKDNEKEREEAHAKEQAAQQKQQEDEQSNENFSTVDEPSKDEQLQANEQWLKRIPDDPGGLLKRKFKYQYNQRQRAPNRQAEQW